MRHKISIALLGVGLLLSGLIMPAKSEDFALYDPFAQLKQELSENTKILTFETRRISAKYPSDTINQAGINYPGYRGAGQLIIYYPGFNYSTGTNEFGTEAVVEDGVVVKLTGADSIIPNNGFVVSGHGSSKTWIKNNLKIGTQVLIEGNTIIAYTTPDSIVYTAREKIKEAEEFIENVKKSEIKSEESNKKAIFYLKKAKNELKKAEKAREGLKRSYAKSSIEFSNLAIKYSLPYLENEFKGVWIRPTEQSMADVKKTLDTIKGTGIKEVFLETFFHGYTIYPSDVMKQYGLTYQNPKFQGYDPLKAYVDEAHKRGMKVHVWFESFYIGNKHPQSDLTSILSVYPSWGNKNLANYNSETYVSHKVEHNGYFLDPANPAVTDFLIQLLSEISTKYGVDGINLDYTRYPSASSPNIASYRQSNWGYTEIARKNFKELYEVDPVEIQKDDEVLWRKWSEFRQDMLYDYVKRARETVSDKILLSAVIFPDYNLCLATKQQDWAKWSRDNLIDAMTPLIMTSDNELFEKILKGVKVRASHKTKIITGLFVGFLDAEPEDLLRQISVSRAYRTEGVILFDWAHLPVKYQNALKYRVFLPKKN